MNFRFNYFNVIFYGIIGYFIGGQIYESVFLPYISESVGINQIWRYSSEKIHEIVVYNNRNAYLWLEPNSQRFFNVLRIGVYDPNAFMGILTSSLENFKEIPVYFKTTISISLWDIVLYTMLFNIMGTAVKMVTKSVDTSDTGNKIEKNVKTKLKDIAGNHEIKEEAMEFVDMIKNYDKYKDVGARLPHGALFVGPPGTGKTLLAKAIAGECDLPFISASGSDFNEIFVGLGAARVKKLFENARENKPCILFIDEIDALAHKRSKSSHHHDDRENTLNALLVEMDGFNTDDGVIVFGATNRVDMLDPAVMRPGRFDRKIIFSVPEKNDRMEIFNYYFDKIKLNEELNKEEEIDRITDITYGFSGADISNICNEATIIATRKEKDSVDSEDLMDAYEYINIGTEKKNYFLLEDEKKCIAYHETGHAFLAHVLKDAERPVQISIIPRGKSALGYTLSNHPEKKLRKKNELLAEIAVMCGGRIAEELFTDDITTGAMNDFEKAHQMARNIVASYSMMRNENILVIDDENIYMHGDKTKSEIDELANDLINSIYTEARNLIKVNKDEFDRLARYLFDNKKMDKKDINDVYPNRLKNLYSLKIKQTLDTNKKKTKKIHLETIAA